MNRAEFQASLAKLTHRTRYLELGLYDASTFLTIAPYVQYAVGIDINEINVSLPSNCIIHKTTTDLFFEHNQEMFDYVFIDADHSYNSVRIDLENSLRFLTDDGIILLHDTDPISKKYLDPGYCNDCYKIVDYLYERSDLDHVTIPLEEAGMTIIRRKNTRRIHAFV